jgi:seryl-tRNA synthetase
MEALAAAETPGDDYKDKVSDFRARWRKMSGRPSREQDITFKTLFASLISKNAEAFKGTDMDVDENRKKLEKLVVKLEALESDKVKVDSMDLATKLKEAWASRTMGAKPGGSSFKAEVEKARSIYEKLGPVVGDEGEALRKRFEAICRKLG